MAVSFPIRKLTVDEYHRMGEVGIIDPEESVELLDGLIYAMSPIGSQHAALVEHLADLLRDGLDRQYMVRTQNPIRLDLESEPEPDIVLCDFDQNYYSEAHPAPGDIILVIEVADSFLEKDLDLKTRLYARSGIPDYWVLEAGTGVLHLHAEPTEDGYLRTETLTKPDEVALPGLDRKINLKALWR